MHVLFVHQNFPAQFGHLAQRLVQEHRFRATFVTHRDVGSTPDINVLRYRPRGGATRGTHYFARTFENAVAHAHGVFETCRAHRDLRPDLIVGHSGFGSTLFLRELFDCPIINYFEYYYHPHGSDLDFRPDRPPLKQDVLRSYCRNAMPLLDLENCDAGYAPTEWQRSRLPERFRDKVAVIFDGIDQEVWRRNTERVPEDPWSTLPEGTPVVTYVSRGFESMRGFDVFMRVAKRVYEAMPNVVFFVVGADRVAYGGDGRFTNGRSFREYVLAQDQYDISKFVFTGRLAPQMLARLLSASNLHIYLTAPFVLSWSLLNALACGATVLASDTAPVREVIHHRETGLLANFFDVEALSETALEVLRAPDAYRHLGEAGQRLIDERYALEQTMPKILDLFERVCSGAGTRRAT